MVVSRAHHMPWFVASSRYATDNYNDLVNFMFKIVITSRSLASSHMSLKSANNFSEIFRITITWLSSRDTLALLQVK